MGLGDYCLIDFEFCLISVLSVNWMPRSYALCNSPFIQL